MLSWGKKYSKMHIPIKTSVNVAEPVGKWCSRILQRVNQLSRKAIIIIITWENDNSMGRKRREQWPLSCQTAGWCFSQWFGVPSLSCSINFTEHCRITQDSVYFCGQNLGQDPLAGHSAFSRMDPQPHNYFLFLAPLSSHHSYERGFEEVHGVRQSKRYLNSFEDATATSSVTVTC